MTEKISRRTQIVLGAGGVAALVMVVLGILANHIVPWLSGTVSVFLSWIIIFSTLLGIAGLGVGFIGLAVRNPRP